MLNLHQRMKANERICSHGSCVSLCRLVKMQEAMKEYLRERNVGDDMAAFICMYADHKEQSEYLNWLEEVESFIK